MFTIKKTIQIQMVDIDISSFFGNACILISLIFYIVGDWKNSYYDIVVWFTLMVYIFDQISHISVRRNVSENVRTRSDHGKSVDRFDVSDGP